MQNQRFTLQIRVSIANKADIFQTVCVTYFAGSPADIFPGFNREIKGNNTTGGKVLDLTISNEITEIGKLRIMPTQDNISMDIFNLANQAKQIAIIRVI